MVNTEKPEQSFAVHSNYVEMFNNDCNETQNNKLFLRTARVSTDRN